MSQIIGASSAQPTDLESRLSHVERQVGRIEVGMDAFKEKTSEQLETISNQLGSITKAQTEGAKTPWNLIFSGAGLLVGVMISIGSLVTNGLAKQDLALDERLEVIETLALERAGILAAQNERIAGLESTLAIRIERQQDIANRLNVIEGSRYTPIQASLDQERQEQLIDAKIGVLNSEIRRLEALLEKD